MGWNLEHLFSWDPEFCGSVRGLLQGEGEGAEQSQASGLLPSASH